MRPLVVALNPSVDVEWRVARVRWEEKNEVLAERRWAGGKGINVARWLRHLGARPQLLLPLGGATGREMAGWLRAEKISTIIIPLREATRANVIVSSGEGGQLRFNPAGPKLAAREWRSVLAGNKTALPGASVQVLSGSLPRGVPVTAYAGLIGRARRAGVKTLLDCDGPALAAAVGAGPFLVKPNVDELARWRGRTLASVTAVRAAAHALSKATGGWVLVSLGARGGLLVHAREGRELRAPAPRVSPVNTVGAGDALLAAVARRMEQGEPPEEWLRWGVAVGTAATQLTAGQLPVGRLLERMLAAVSVR